MRYCEFCEATLPDDARFCGSCGNILDSSFDEQTRSSMVLQFNAPQADAVPAAVRTSQPGITPVPSPSNPISQPDWYSPPVEEGAPANLASSHTTPTGPLNDEEEEKRRKAALLGLGLVGLEALHQGSQVPMTQGTPSIGSVPFAQGAPQAPGASLPGSFITPPAQVSPHYPTPSMPPTSISSPSLPTHTLPHGPHGSQGQQGQTGTGGSQHPHPPKGCGPQAMIAAIVIVMVIAGSIIGLGLTVFAPSLSLSGSSSVSAGETLNLHGSHFVPGSSVTLLLDGSTPLSATRFPTRNALAHSIEVARSVSMAVGIAENQGAITAGGDGTFTVSINVNASWTPGQHTIMASEAVTHRSATLDFTVLAPGETPTQTSTGTITPSPSPTKQTSPTISPSAPSTQPGLSCLNPSSLSLGPVLANSAQAATSSITLCSNGTGVVNWLASWDTTSAPWLSVSPPSGQLNAPAQTTVAISASAAQLGAGNYSAVVTFSSSSSAVTETLNISFAVQAGCIKASPPSLSFTGVAGVSDPPSQTLSISSCSTGGPWQASTKTNDGANWLSVSPTSGSVSSSGSGAPPSSVTVSVSNLKTQLAAGQYTGSITFTLGSGTFVVQVSLTVQPAPVLSSNTNSLVGSSNCPTPGGPYICYVTLTNTSTSTGLTWTSSVTNLPDAAITPASDTLGPGQSERVRITIPPNDCSAGASITFTGPANTVTVNWQCTLPIT
jgi:hypothetical protein